MEYSTILIFAICLFVVNVNALTDEEIAAFVSRDYVGDTGFVSTVSVTIASDDDTVLILGSNGIPDHDTDSSLYRNTIEEQVFSEEIPRYPVQKSTTTCTPMGPIGMAINGVAIFNPYSSECCDAGVTEFLGFDECFGHPSPNNQYHYHLAPVCLFDVCSDAPSTIIGVAFDGFPIYGPIDENGVHLTKSDLDECGGKETAAGEYRYHVINEFPYIIGCYRGTPFNVRDCPCTEPIDCNDRKRRSVKKRQADVPFECPEFTTTTTSTTTTTAPPTTTRRTRRPGRRRRQK